MIGPKRKCSVNECQTISKTTGLCVRHYQKQMRDKPLTARPCKTKRYMFIKNVPATDECVIWPYATRGGYGVLSYKGREVISHRLSLWEHSGPPPTERHQAAHDPIVCNNKLCINPRHLRWATPKENSHDKYKAGTMLRGTDTGRLTESQVRDIFTSNLNASALSQKYKVAWGHIHAIRQCRIWAWLTEGLVRGSAVQTKGKCYEEGIKMEGQTWRQQAAQIIADATKDLPADTPLGERKRTVDAACPWSWRMLNYPQKAWQAARRDYLVRFGYEPRTKAVAARKASAVGDLPLFQNDGV